jgi:phosphatidylserine/phosphatidylglycerophosphate/cardiolipin synthase-like enzyme
MLLFRIPVLLALFSAAASAGEPLDITPHGGRPGLKQNQLVYLNNSELAVASRYLDIAGAKSSIDMTYLEWDPCSTISKVLVKGLVAKANGNPKVPVRILIDSYFQWAKGGKKLLSQMQTYYRSLGFAVKFFNPPDIGITGGNEHSHSKLLLIDKYDRDNAKFISGGRNMTDAYFGMDKDSLIDRDVEFRGPSRRSDPGGVISQASTGFDRLWANPKGKPVEPASAADMQDFAKCVAWTPREAALDSYMKKNAAKIVAQGQRTVCPDVAYTIDDVTGTSQKPTTDAVLNFLHRANRSLTMENQYYIPTAEERAILAEKRSKVQINLYTNLFDGSTEKVTLYHTADVQEDNVGNQHNYALSRMYNLIDRWQFTPKGALYHVHAKTFVADSRDAAVSSFNLDPRSHGINGESGIFVYNCPTFARQVEYTAQLNAYKMSQESAYAFCVHGYRAEAPTLDPFNFLIQAISRPLQ